MPNLEKEVDLRLGNPEGETRSEEEYRAKTEMYYEGAAFVVKPHLPYVSMKVERKFRGEIADSNPIRLVEENGIFYKVSRKPVEELKATDLPKLYTSDGYLIEALEKAFTEGEKYLNNEDDKENKKDSPLSEASASHRIPQSSHQSPDPDTLPPLPSSQRPCTDSDFSEMPSSP